MNATGIDAALARGIVKHADRIASARFNALLDRGPNSMRFGARTREFTKVLHKSGLPIVLIAAGKSRFDAGVLDPDEHGNFDTALLHFDKSGGEPVSFLSSLGISRHCRERIVQQAVPMGEPLSLLRWMVLTGSARRAVAPGSGWIATPRALWRLDAHKLSTVILADRLDGANKILWERLRAAGDPDKGQWQIEGPDPAPWARIEQIVNYRVTK
jgi:hypothetical protein